VAPALVKLALRGGRRYSQRRSCALIGLQPKTTAMPLRRPDDVPIRQRLWELALERRRFGYRRLHIPLRREGIVLNHKKLYGLYREERLIVRKRGGRKRSLGTRAPMALPQGLNQRWSLDFVSDALACDSSANGGKCAVYLHTVLMGRKRCSEAAFLSGC
jgi:putative transposase